MLAAYGAAVGINLTLTYWLARYALRPWVERLVARAGYKIPTLPEKDILKSRCCSASRPGRRSFCRAICSVWPGGVSDLSVGVMVVAMAYAVGAVLFGEAIVEGRAGLTVMGVCLLIAAILIIHLLRRHYGKRRAEPAK